MTSGSDGCDGLALARALRAAAGALQRRADEVDRLNVFPVPDGDTGANLTATMLAACAAASGAASDRPAETLRLAARGALLGARGNSGVILSQALRGLAEAVRPDRDRLGAEDLAAGLLAASRAADAAVLEPVEGTILTVLREAARAAQAAAAAGRDACGVLGAAHDAAREAVRRTPQQMERLRQAGVVDAGGYGLALLLEGACRFALGEEAPEADLEGRATPLLEGLDAEAQHYGYCISYLLLGRDLRADEIRARLAALGESVLVVGDPAMLKIHVHTHRPGDAVNVGSDHGRPTDFKIDDIDRQHLEWEAHTAMTADGPPPPSPATRHPSLGVVAVACGEGLRRIFQSLGAGAVVQGRQTMNPSVEEIARAIRGLPQAGAVVLPNNENVILTAEQARRLCDKEVRVVPTRTIPQGIAALLSFNQEADLATNEALMKQSAGIVRTLEITRATRPADIGPLHVAQGQALALLDGQAVAADDDPRAALRQALAQVSNGDYGLATIYVGQGATRAGAEALAEELRRGLLGAEVEIQDGGQPHYEFIVSLE